MLDLSVLNTLSKEELIEKIKSLQNEVVTLSNNKKYGLVWEVKDKDREDLYLDKLPYLKNMGKDVVSNPNDINHILIQGENLQALKILKTTHLGRVDLVYIDPPYNTGNTDFKYKDKFIDNEDGYRHSKWLDFMHKRLNIAKDLLNENGIVFISIDDNEVFQLKLLCDEVFGENNFIENFIWEKNNNPTFLSKNTRKNVEYILCYCKTNKHFPLISEIKQDFEDAPLVNKTNPIDTLVFKKGQVEFKIPDGIYNKENIKGDTILLNEVVVKNGTNENDFELKGQFRWRQNFLDKEILNGGKVIIKSNKFSPRFIYGSGKQTAIAPLKTIDIRQNVGTNLESSSLLKQMNIDFDYSKPLSLIKFLLKLIQKKDILILDFFAGSGTTGQAVLELNKEDGGSRQFIICTNNEVDEKLHKELVKDGVSINSEEYEKHGICQSVTYPRIQKVIEGYEGSKDKRIEGLGGNLKYYKIENIDAKDKDTFDVKQELFNNINEILCVGKGIYNKISSTDDYTVYQENGQTMIIANENFLEHLDAIQQTFDKQEGKKIFYYCSLSGIKGIYLTMDIEQNPIPEELMEKYKIINDNLKNNY